MPSSGPWRSCEELRRAGRARDGGGVGDRAGGVGGAGVARPGAPACAGAVPLARQRLGRLDVVIHCAGILRIAPLEATSEKEGGEVLAGNLTGGVLVTKAGRGATR